MIVGNLQLSAFGAQALSCLWVAVKDSYTTPLHLRHLYLSTSAEWIHSQIFDIWYFDDFDSASSVGVFLCVYRTLTHSCYFAFLLYRKS